MDRVRLRDGYFRALGVPHKSGRARGLHGSAPIARLLRLHHDVVGGGGGQRSVGRMDKALGFSALGSIPVNNTHNTFPISFESSYQLYRLTMMLKDITMFEL